MYECRRGSGHLQTAVISCDQHALGSGVLIVSPAKSIWSPTQLRAKYQPSANWPSSEASASISPSGLWKYLTGGSPSTITCHRFDVAVRSTLESVPPHLESPVKPNPSTSRLCRLSLVAQSIRADLLAPECHPHKQLSTKSSTGTAAKARLAVRATSNAGHPGQQHGPLQMALECDVERPGIVAPVKWSRFCLSWKTTCNVYQALTPRNK